MHTRSKSSANNVNNNQTASSNNSETEKEAKRSEARFTVIHHPAAQFSNKIDKAYKDAQIVTGTLGKEVGTSCLWEALDLRVGRLSH